MRSGARGVGSPWNAGAGWYWAAFCYGSGQAFLMAAFFALIQDGLWFSFGLVGLTQIITTVFCQRCFR